MNPVDAAIVVGALGSALLGFRRGFVLRATSALGLVGGLALGAWAAAGGAPRLARGDGRLSISVALPLIGAAIGEALGWAAGGRLRPATRGSAARTLDRLAGSALGAMLALSLSWIVAINLVAAPSPGLRSAIRGSSILAALDATLPAPPAMLSRVRSALLGEASPETFAGIPPTPAALVPLPDQTFVDSLAPIAARSTVRVVAEGCGVRSQGSGVIVGPGLAITAAHVIAGATSVSMAASTGAAWTARVVGLDGDLDLALLAFDVTEAGSGLGPIAFPPTEAGRGALGVVVGFPDDGPISTRGAAVLRGLVAEGRAIDGSVGVERRLVELLATVRPGSSGGPFVLADGTLGGIVLAGGLDAGVAYAIAAGSVKAWIGSLGSPSRTITTGTCALR